MPETPAYCQSDDLSRQLLHQFLGSDSPNTFSSNPTADDLYARLNRFRDWFNAAYPAFDLYLEDVWNERAMGETHLEYILRHPESKDETEPLAADVYFNRRDANGVWHLETYQHSQILGRGTPEGLTQTMAKFMTHYSA